MGDPRWRWSSVRPVTVPEDARQALIDIAEAADLGLLVAVGVLGAVLLCRYERRETVGVWVVTDTVTHLEVVVDGSGSYRDALVASCFTGVADTVADVVVCVGLAWGIDDSSGARLRIEVSGDYGFGIAACGFSEAQADILASCLARLWTGVADRPSTRVSDLPLLPEDDGLAAWDPMPIADASLTPCVHRFEEHARNSPEQIALSERGHELSYRELDARADAFAVELKGCGIDRGSVVGLTGVLSAGVVVAIVALHKLAAAYVPLDPANPKSRLHEIARDSGLRVVIDCGGGWVPDGDGLDVVSLPDVCGELDGGGARTSTQPMPAAVGEVVAADLAYVIYTSGSTGAPKGVLVSQGNVTRLFTEIRPLMALDANDVWTFFHSYAFDFSVWEIWGALVHGARLVVVPFEVSRDPGRLLDLLVEERVTILSQTPSAFSVLVSEDARREEPTDLALRHVVFGGEALDYAVLARWVERHPLGSPRLVNMYGITETTVHVTVHEVRPGDLHAGTRTIGRPIPDLRVYLVDERGKLVPDGAVGEMWVAGPSVAQGYLNRPGLTRERFLVLPGTHKTPVYRSGDLARVGADGLLEFLGRVDNQVKVRGHRVELGEVEAAVRAHSAVEAACVLAEEGADTRTRLVAYVVPIDGADLTRRELFAFIRTRLPIYMIPQTWVIAPKLPLTANGKIDRAALARARVGAILAAAGGTGRT